jgi:hypothetical protein
MRISLFIPSMHLTSARSAYQALSGCPPQYFPRAGDFDVFELLEPPVLEPLGGGPFVSLI